MPIDSVLEDEELVKEIKCNDDGSNKDDDGSEADEDAGTTAEEEDGQAPMKVLKKAPMRAPIRATMAHMKSRRRLRRR